MDIMKTNPIGCPKLRGNIKSIKYPAWVEIKYDGEFCWLIQEPDYTKMPNPCLVNKYGTTRFNSCVIDQYTINKSSVKLLGELYYKYGMAGDLYSLLSHKQDESVLTFRPFDIAEYNERPLLNEPLVERKEILARLYGSAGICEGKVVQNEAEVIDYFQEKTNKGYEGVVVKNLDGRLVINGACDWVKIKHKDQNDYKITSIDQHKERVEYSVVTPTVTKINAVKVMDKVKQTMQVGDIITIEHQGILPAGGLRHPVYIAHHKYAGNSI